MKKSILPSIIPNSSIQIQTNAKAMAASGTGAVSVSDFQSLPTTMTPVGSTRPSGPSSRPRSTRSFTPSSITGSGSRRSSSTTGPSSRPRSTRPLGPSSRPRSQRPIRSQITTKHAVAVNQIWLFLGVHQVFTAAQYIQIL